VSVIADSSKKNTRDGIEVCDDRQMEVLSMTTTRSFLGHLEELRLTLDTTREYVRTNVGSFARTASRRTLARTDRTIAKIQGQIANLDSELNSVAYEITRKLRPD
jgi:hypothetical protein